jgi:AhpD family alkylhydroperoxidase
VGILGSMDKTAAPEQPITQSVFLDKENPAVWKALNGLKLKAREAAEEAGLDRTLTELLNIRISQINGCAYCLDVHVQDALENGETSQRLAVLPAWRETGLFTEKERAALALAEAVTNVSDTAARERDSGYARHHLTVGEFSVISWLAISMNSFNRLSIISEHPVRRRQL